MARFVSAATAIARLRIRKPTLYAYVSRGLIRAQTDPADARKSLYLLSDIDDLATRKKHGRGPAAAAKAAISWGLPVLETAISTVERGRLSYRGVDAITLALRGASLEETACLLWGCAADHDPFAHLAKPARIARRERATPLRTAIHYLAETQAPQRQSSDGRTPWSTAAYLLRTVAGTLLGRASDLPVHKAAAAAWGLTPQQAEILRIALVVCADHELNVSTFTVRCVASAQADLAMALIAGLSALSGPLHGGATARATGFWDDLSGPRMKPLPPPSPAVFTMGLGHPLYPDGDPRARVLLDQLPSLPVRRVYARLAKADLPQPNVDFALGAIAQGLRLPPGSALTLFALSRTAGWLAHAMEQQAGGQLIRPRARYVGHRPA